MCGIVGVVGNLPTKEKFEIAREIIAHRGPDDKGLYYNKEEGVALGHRRLSIIDLSADGHQPFFSNDGRYVMIFNGEIYNYVELKNELRSFYDFKTKTDTEVLLAAYIKWGEDCVHKFNGMFAFVIWDKVRKRLICGRDRLGIKPFFYFFSSKSFYFASEIKALLGLGICSHPNEPIIFDYLYHGLYDHSEETFFEGIKTLPPGSLLIYENNHFIIKKYWDLANISAESFGNETEDTAMDKLRELLSDSVKLRFRSDVPVGVNLSSGLDSNSLYYFASQIVGNNFQTFSMCSKSEEYNECDIIKSSLGEIQKRTWHNCFIDPQQVLSAAEKMNVIQDQPYGGIPTISYDFLIRLSEISNVVVLLEGQGVDEILAGYPYYKSDYEKDLIGENISAKSGVIFGQDMSKLVNPSILNKDFVRSFKRDLFFSAPFKSHLLNAQYRDIRYTKLPRVLRFNDHVTMHHSCELRLPFLDYRIVEFCFFLPANLKIKNKSHKYILRKLMNGIVPDQIRQKEKKVFGAIQNEWLKEHFREQVYDTLDSVSLMGKKYWNMAKLRAEIDKFYRGERNNSFFIWQCFNLEMWFKKFIFNK